MNDKAYKTRTQSNATYLIKTKVTFPLIDDEGPFEGTYE